MGSRRILHPAKGKATTAKEVPEATETDTKGPRKWSLTSTDTFYTATEFGDDTTSTAERKADRSRRHTVALLGPPKLRTQRPEPDAGGLLNEVEIEQFERFEIGPIVPSSDRAQPNGTEGDAGEAVPAPTKLSMEDAAVHIDFPASPKTHVMRPLSWLNRVRPSTVRHMRADLNSQFTSKDSSEDISTDHGDIKTASTASSRSSGERYPYEPPAGKAPKALLGLVVSLGIMFVVTLGGLIYLLRTRNSSPSLVNDHFWGPGYIPHMSYTPRPIDWEPITATDPGIKALLAQAPVPPQFMLSGVTYMPESTDQARIYEDVAQLSLITNRVRLRSTDNYCADYVLQAFKDCSLGNMTLALGLEVDTEEHVLKQLADFRDIVMNRPVVGTLGSVYVGEDSLFRGRIDQETLQGYIDYVRDFMFREGVSGVRVGTADRTQFMSKSVVATTVDPLAHGYSASYTVEALNADPLRVHTNIGDHHSTDARSLHAWLHDVAPNLSPDVVWYWQASNTTTLYNMVQNIAANATAYP